MFDFEKRNVQMVPRERIGRAGVTPITSVYDRLNLTPATSHASYEPQVGDWIEILNSHGDPVSRGASVFSVISLPSGGIQLGGEYVRGTAFDYVLTSPETEAADAYPRKLEPLFIRKWMPSFTISPDATTKPTGERIMTGQPEVASGCGIYVVGKTTFPDVDKNSWVPLEKGLEIQFTGTHYQTGDYWLIVIRDGEPILYGAPSISPHDCAVPPRGYHHYAPIGFMVKENDAYHVEYPYRKKFEPAGIPYHICPTSNEHEGNPFESCEFNWSAWEPGDPDGHGGTPVEENHECRHRLRVSLRRQTETRLPSSLTTGWPP